MSINMILEKLNKSPKFMNESRSSKKLQFKSNSKGFKSSELYRVCDDVLVFSNSDDTPVPWDCEISIEGSNVVLRGHVGPSGFGECIVKVPLSSVNRVYSFEVMGDENDMTDFFEIHNINLI